MSDQRRKNAELLALMLDLLHEGWKPHKIPAKVEFKGLRRGYKLSWPQPYVYPSNSVILDLGPMVAFVRRLRFDRLAFFSRQADEYKTDLLTLIGSIDRAYLAVEVGYHSALDAALIEATRIDRERGLGFFATRSETNKKQTGNKQIQTKSEGG